MTTRRFNPLLAILIVLAASGLSWAGREFKEGQRYLELGAYSQAITHLEAAFDASKPDSRERQKIEEIHCIKYSCTREAAVVALGR